MATFSSAALRELTKQIEALLEAPLFAAVAEAPGADPQAMQFFVLAMGALDQAQRFMTLAQLTQSRAVFR